MKQLEINLKEITKAGMIAFVELGDTGLYWVRQVGRTVHGLMVDTFSMKLSGNIQDFTWGEGEQLLPLERKPEVQPSAIRSESAREARGEDRPAPTKSRFFMISRMIFIRPLKRFLRFFFIDLPEWIKPPAGEADDPDPYANRFRSGD